MTWQIPNRTPESRQRAAYVAKLRRTTFWKRLDITLIMLVFLLVVLVGGGWFVVGEISRRAVARSTPPLSALSDPRILTNLRADLPDQALLDATGHNGTLAISQQGRILHLYDPATRLWTTESALPDANAPLAEDFIQVGSSGGVLWARGADGSLARRDADGWHVAVGNTAFLDPTRQPVTQDMLTTAAVSEDGTMLAVGTDGAGVGLYDIRAHSWLPSNPDTPLTINHIAAWGDVFFVGTPDDGLYRLTFEGAVSPVEGVRGTIRDIAVAADGLYVIERYGCIDAGDGCLRLLRFNVDDEFTAVMDERNNYADLNPQVLHFAQDWGAQTAFAGQSGIYRYDTNLRGWDQLHSGRIGRTAPLLDDAGFYFESARLIGLAQPAGDVQTWDLPTNQPLQSLVLVDGRPLALAQDGGLYTVTADGLQTLRSGGGTITDPARFTRVLAVDDMMLFVHGDGVLMHDTRRRTYDNIEADDVPDWFLNAGEIIHTGDTVFVVHQANPAEVYAIPAADLAHPAFVGGRGLFALSKQTIAGPVQAAWAWGVDALGILGDDGSLYRFDAVADTLTPLISEALDVSTPVLIDAAPLPDGIAFALPDRLLRYRFNTRTWTTTDVITAPNERLREILVHDGAVLAVTDSGRLIDESGSAIIDPARGQTYDTTLMSDAWATTDALYTAGAGVIERYDFAQRGITQTWTTGSGDVLLRGIIDNTPLAQVGSQAFLGDTELAPGAGAVVSLSHDDRWIWTVSELATHRYLMGQPLTSPNDLATMRCFFRNPSPGGSILDAVRLPDGIVAASTTSGLRFYRPDARTWVTAPASVLSPQRVFLLADALLLATETEYELLSLADLQLPNPCSDAPATLTTIARESVQAIAVDAANLRFAWLRPDGSVSEWSAGVQRDVMLPSGNPPVLANLRRVYDRSVDGYWLFTTADALWRYDLRLRSWQAISLAVPPGIMPVDVVAEFNGAVVTVLAQDSNGSIYRGTFEALPAANVPAQVAVEPTSTAPDTPFQPQETVNFTYGDVTVKAGPDSVSVTLNGIDAFSAQGFIWDRDRRGLAYSPDGLLLQTAAGVHLLDRLATFDTRPAGTLYGLAVDGVFARDTAGTWQQFQDGNWVLADNPLLTRPLFSDTIWMWALQDGVPQITLNGDAHNFAVTPDGFTADQLQAAAAYEGQLFVATDAFTEIAAPDLFADYGAVRSPANPVDRYEVLHFADDTTSLFAYAADSSISQWDGTAFTSVTVDPAQSRSLVSRDRLRLTLDNGRILPELRLDGVGGGSSWVAFGFDDHRWPFDVVISAASFEDTLYAGTQAGLLVYTTPGRALNDATQFLDFRADPSAALAAVDRVGVPVAAPDTLMARESAVCLEQSRGSGFVPCVDHTRLDNRLRIDSRFWQWTLGSTLIGRYRDASGVLDTRTIAIADGRLPHDHVSDAVYCDGETLTLWDNGTISHHSGTTIALPTGLQTYFVSGVNQLRCIENETYALGGSVLRYDSGSWQAVDPTLAQTVRDYQLPIYERSRLRYANDLFQYQRLDGTWQDVPWQFDSLAETWRLELDVWQYALPVGDQLWMATSAGWLPFSIDSEGQAVIDPSTLIVVDDGVPDECRVTDAQTDGEQLTFRCEGDSNRVYTGQPDSTRDQSVFNAASNDPFAEAVLIDNPLWQWRLEGRVNGAPGTLAGTWQGEPVSLANGHFGWDTLTGIAFFTDGIVDLTAEGAGWLTTSSDDFTLTGMARPNTPQAASLNAVHIAPDSLLCLRLSDGDFLRFNTERQFQDQSADCPKMLGSDNLWFYTRTSDRLRIVDVNDTGARRNLNAGRFTDDWALGIPVFDLTTQGYWLPTPAGVVGWNTAYVGQSISGGDFPGLPSETPPESLLLHTNQLLYPGNDGLYALSSGELVYELDFTGLETARIEHLEQNGNLVEIIWADGTRRGFSRFDLTDNRRADNSLTIDTLELSAFVENRQAWGDPAPVLLLRFELDRIDAQFAGRTQTYSLPASFMWERVMHADERIYLIGPIDVMTISLNAVLYDMAP